MLVLALAGCGAPTATTDAQTMDASASSEGSVLLEAIAALSPAYMLDESWKTRRARARVRLIELADLLPTVHRTLNSTITMLYAAERKHEPNATPVPRFAPKP